ncbi:hypothetical protein KIPB_014768, partial [Kipferlia bialata]|eukprot:g14768.t1
MPSLLLVCIPPHPRFSFDRMEPSAPNLEGASLVHNPWDEDKAYLVGGFGEDGYNDVISEYTISDGSHTEWDTTLTDMGWHGLVKAGVAVLKSPSDAQEIVIIGGYHNVGNTVTSEVLIVDIATQE